MPEHGSGADEIEIDLGDEYHIKLTRAIAIPGATFGEVVSIGVQ